MRRFPRLFTYCLAAFALTAGASAGATPRLTATVAGADRVFQGLPQSDWPTTAWWEAFGDPQLDSLISDGLKGSPTLVEAAARVRTAEALTAQAASASLPKLSAYGSYTELKADIPPIVHGYNDTGVLLLNFGWDLDFFGRNRAAVRAAVSDSRAAMAESAEARLGLTTAIAATYADLARLYIEHDVAERALDLRQETEGLVVKRVDNGLDTRAAGGPA
jgi:outer membrane protein TolC